jgi:hypothetical protein
MKLGSSRSLVVRAAFSSSSISSGLRNTFDIVLVFSIQGDIIFWLFVFILMWCVTWQKISQTDLTSRRLPALALTLGKVKSSPGTIFFFVVKNRSLRLGGADHGRSACWSRNYYDGWMMRAHRSAQFLSISNLDEVTQAAQSPSPRTSRSGSCSGLRHCAFVVSQSFHMRQHRRIGSSPYAIHDTADVKHFGRR